MTTKDLPRGPPTTILVVESNLPVRAFAAEVLSDAGIAVLQASGVADAINILSKREVDLIFSNIGPGGETARPLTCWVKQNRPDIPVLLCSGGSDWTPRHRSPYISKPYRPTDLLKVISEVLATRRSIALDRSEPSR